MRAFVTFVRGVPSGFVATVFVVSVAPEGRMTWTKSHVSVIIVD